MKNKIALLLAFLVIAVGIVCLSPLGRYVGWAWRRVAGDATVQQRLVQYGPAARNRLTPYFESVGLSYPPAQVTLIGIKDQKVLEVWATGIEGGWQPIRTYPILAASGDLGPKLCEGDRQVPEGIYEIESLHPNSMYHLALRVNYPNGFDREKGREDGRTNLGGDIMIHGSNASVGCLAMGDEAAEELFVLVADTGIENTQLILTPVDFRVAAHPTDIADLPSWTEGLYLELEDRLEAFRRIGEQ